MTEPATKYKFTTYDPSTARKPSPKSRRNVLCFFVTLAAIGGGAIWVYPGPQIRAEHTRQAQIVAEEQKQVRKARQAAIFEAEQKQLERQTQEIVTATSEQLTTLVNACENSIRAKLVSPFDVYFARYKSHDLQPLKTASMVFGTATGRPSVMLDKYDFDPVHYNVMQLQDPARREYWNISFVIEGAEDGLSVKNFAAIYECDVQGLKPTQPKEISRLYF